MYTVNSKDGVLTIEYESIEQRPHWPSMGSYRPYRSTTRRIEVAPWWAFWRTPKFHHHLEYREPEPPQHGFACYGGSFNANRGCKMLVDEIA